MAAKGQHASIFDRLTDSTLYTGTHKHRFDENGQGRGLAGRDRVAKGAGLIAGAPGGAVADLSQITRSNLNTAGGGRPAGPHIILYQRSPSNDGGFSISPLPSPGTPSPGAPSPRPGSVGRGALRASMSGALRTSGTNPATARASDTGERRSVFDRLNDPSTFTVTHRERFSSDGRGRGAAGRTTPNAYVSAAQNVCR